VRLLRAARDAYLLIASSGLCGTVEGADFWCMPMLWKNAGVRDANVFGFFTISNCPLLFTPSYLSLFPLSLSLPLSLRVFVYLDLYFFLFDTLRTVSECSVL
jgi:hypothetical protein